MASSSSPTATNSPTSFITCVAFLSAELKWSNKQINVQTHIILSFNAQKYFLLMIYSVNVTKSAGNWGSGHIYWRNASWKTSFFGAVIPIN